MTKTSDCDEDESSFDRFALIEFVEEGGELKDVEEGREDDVEEG